MPLISRKKDDNTVVKIKIEKALLDEIEAYAAWAELPSRDTFLTEAAAYVLQKDKEWKAARKAQRKQKRLQKV